MKTSSCAHPWDVIPREAIAIQNKLRPLLSLRWDNPPVRRVGGIDCSYARGADDGYAVVVVMVWPTLDPWAWSHISDQRVTSGDYCSTPLPSAVRRPRSWEGTRRWKTCGGPLHPFSIRAEKWARP